MFPQSLPFEPIHTTQYCVSGDVVIHEGAAIAPGVLLQADPGSRILIRSGVCIGLGSVLHATHGTITIHEGANLGAGVLLLGDVCVGARACLGSAVTVLDSEIAGGQMIAAGTVIGDRSRAVDLEEILQAAIQERDQKQERDRHAESEKAERNRLKRDRSVERSASSPEPTFQWTTCAAPSTKRTGAAQPLPNQPLQADRQGNSWNGSSYFAGNGAADKTATQATEAKAIEDPWDERAENLSNPTPDPAPAAADETHPAPQQAANPPRDNSGKPWQACDRNPWDPTDNPAGETTCRIPMPDQEFQPYDPNPWSDRPTSSPFPPFPSQPTPSTSTWVDPTEPPASAHPQPSHPNETQFFSAFPTAPATTTETNTWLNDGNDSPISAHPQPTYATGEVLDSDLSAVELQTNPNPTTAKSPEEKRAEAAESAELATQQPKQVYGQAYVNQMLGKMLGKG
jgi:carbon dioxide concentrating mechanism protein CcmN